VTLISPPPHHDIYSIEDLKQLIYDLKAVNPRARVSVKLVAQAGVGTVAAGVAKAGADVVVIAGWNGGTGAAPLSSLKHAGIPWEMGLSEAQQVLVLNDLRRRVRLQADGGLRTSRDVILAAMMGAEEFGFATSALVAEGCVMLRKCHKNTCSVGIATQDPRLREKFAGKVEEVMAFFTMLAEGVRRRMAALGARSLDELVGQVEHLRVLPGSGKARRLDLSGLVAAAPVGKDVPRRFCEPWPDGHADHMDHELLRQAAGALEGGAPALIQGPVHNTDRAVGARLSGELARRFGAAGLPPGKVQVKLKGSAGQSFGAFLCPGVTLWLEGDANDYLGKGLCGGRVIVRPPEGARFAPEDNVIIGNTALYGATSGEVFVSGLAGERFAVRNSGARAVVEGLGDHGCEYMTGGVVAVLGPVGRNFAAGMSGGMAFVFDKHQALRERCNLAQVELESVVSESDLWLLHTLIDDHARHTGSPLARRLLDHWGLTVSRFVKVMPTEYKRALQQQRAQALLRTGS
jgi:glutamate synthase (NADPH/NADH) large chain